MPQPPVRAAHAAPPLWLLLAGVALASFALLAGLLGLIGAWNADTRLAVIGFAPSTALLSLHAVWRATQRGRLVLRCMGAGGVNGVLCLALVSALGEPALIFSGLVVAAVLGLVLGLVFGLLFLIPVRAWSALGESRLFDRAERFCLGLGLWLFAVGGLCLLDAPLPLVAPVALLGALLALGAALTLARRRLWLRHVRRNRCQGWAVLKPDRGPWDDRALPFFGPGPHLAVLVRRLDCPRGAFREQEVLVPIAFVRA